MPILKSKGFMNFKLLWELWMAD